MNNTLPVIYILTQLLFFRHKIRMLEKKQKGKRSDATTKTRYQRAFQLLPLDSFKLDINFLCNLIYNDVTSPKDVWPKQDYNGIPQIKYPCRDAFYPKNSNFSTDTIATFHGNRVKRKVRTSFQDSFQNVDALKVNFVRPFVTLCTSIVFLEPTVVERVWLKRFSAGATTAADSGKEQQFTTCLLIIEDGARFHFVLSFVHDREFQSSCTELAVI